MTEELILTEGSVASEEQAVSEAPKTAKKAYVTPQMEIEYFDIEDVIATSGGGGGGGGGGDDGYRDEGGVRDGWGSGGLGGDDEGEEEGL